MNHTCDKVTTELSSLMASSTSRRFGFAFLRKIAVAKSSALQKSTNKTCTLLHHIRYSYYVTMITFRKNTRKLWHYCCNVVALAVKSISSAPCDHTTIINNGIYSCIHVTDVTMVQSTATSVKYQNCFYNT